MTRRKDCRNRQGFTLLEVVLALAILVGALAVLGELASLGARNARAARDLSIAQLLCESKWSELAAGITSVSAVNGSPISTLPGDMGYGWVYSVALNSTDDTGLATLQVTVSESLPPEQQPISYSLTGWITDPTIAADEAAAESAESTASGTSSSAQGGTSGSSGGGSSSGSTSGSSR